MMASLDQVTCSLHCIYIWFLFWCCIASSSALCPIRCTCDEDKLSVDCRDALLDLVPITLNPSLSELYLGSNQIKSISSSFIFYRKLEFLDLEHNFITSIGEKNFAAQKSLKVLLLNRNRIELILRDAFVGLTALRLLSMTDNELQGIEGRSFVPLANLEKLDLSINKISVIPTDSFAGLVNLKSLSLRRNQFKFIPREPLRVLRNLTKLDLGQNPVSLLNQHSFPDLELLRELNLDGCQIMSIDTGAFFHVSGLKSLNLDANKLKSVPVLEQLHDLEKLSIGKNEIQVIEANAFKGLSQLKHLTIRSDRSLHSIEEGAFASNPQLYKLVIESCPKLRILERRTFHLEKNSLKHLSLRSNGLSFLGPEVLPWDALHHLDIRGNPFNCSCSMLWFARLIKKENISSEDDLLKDVICEDPPEARGHQMAFLPLEMSCFESNVFHASQTSITIIMTITILVSSIFCSLVCAALLFFRSHRKKNEQVKSFFSQSPSSSSPRSDQKNVGYNTSENNLNFVPESTTINPYQVFYGAYERNEEQEDHYALPEAGNALSLAPGRRKSKGATIGARINEYSNPVIEASPYASSFVIQYPIKMDSIYRL